MCFCFFALSRSFVFATSESVDAAFYRLSVNGFPIDLICVRILYSFFNLFYSPTTTSHKAFCLYLLVRYKIITWNTFLSAKFTRLTPMLEFIQLPTILTTFFCWSNVTFVANNVCLLLYVFFCQKLSVSFFLSTFLLKIISTVFLFNSFFPHSIVKLIFNCLKMTKYRVRFWCLL